LDGSPHVIRYNDHPMALRCPGSGRPPPHQKPPSRPISLLADRLGPTAASALRWAL